MPYCMHAQLNSQFTASVSVWGHHHTPTNLAPTIPFQPPWQPPSPPHKPNPSLAVCTPIDPAFAAAAAAVAVAAVAAACGGPAVWVCWLHSKSLTASDAPNYVAGPQMLLPATLWCYPNTIAAACPTLPVAGLLALKCQMHFDGACFTPPSQLQSS